MDLFGQHGFAPVTVQQIALHAGVTERTFYRHFTSKEEVLFSEGKAILELIVSTVDAVDEAASPREVIDTVVAQLAKRFEADREAHRIRAAVITSDPALLERELLKQEQWVRTIARLLTKRGLTEHRALVLSAAATSTFRMEYLSWANDRARTGMTHRVRSSLDALLVDLA